MPHGRLTIARMLGAILFVGAILAGLRSGSNDSFKTIYTLTFLALVYAAIAARYRGPFWHGFAVAGWAYFLLAFGPWIAAVHVPGVNPLQTVNRNLVTSLILEVVTGAMAAQDAPTPPGGLGAVMGREMREANRNGICHSALTIFLATAGGLVARAVARRPAARDNSPPP